MSNTRPLISSKPVAIDKTPSCLASPDELQAGDILLFDTNINQPKAGSHPTVLGQHLLNYEGGHKSVIHAAFIVEIHGEKKMVHLRGNGFCVDDPNIIKAVTHIYRPRIHQTEIADELSQYIEKHHDQLEGQLHWKFAISFYAYIRRLANGVGIRNTHVEDIHKASSVEEKNSLPSQDQFISSWSICSKFLAQSYANSCHSLTKETGHDFRNELMNITTNTIPKTLQAYLYRCSNYDYYVMPYLKSRGKIVEKLSEILNKEITRLLKTGNSNAISKAQALKSEIDDSSIQHALALEIGNFNRHSDEEKEDKST
jgi:hypothetical protein